MEKSGFSVCARLTCPDAKYCKFNVNLEEHTLHIKIAGFSVFCLINVYPNRSYFFTANPYDYIRLMLHLRQTPGPAANQQDKQS
ncbi:hypothetical protein GJ496_007063 [Pomphorhynchus laevis]|nr:hypothetical protein GJ496_007063 [Pomphorhynchus laevis]